MMRRELGSAAAWPLAARAAAGDAAHRTLPESFLLRADQVIE
jgi:hypothetical protein